MRTSPVIIPVVDLLDERNAARPQPPILNP